MAFMLLLLDGRWAAPLFTKTSESPEDEELYFIMMNNVQW